MNYIILDLEWNQCPQGKERENPRIPFEIVEIGAVKMNAQKEILDIFSELICPQVYRKIHFRTKEIINVTMEELKQARPFKEVVQDFFSWCGDDFKICTWGSSDLIELQRNMKFYRIHNPLPVPLFFYDIQKLFSLLYEDGKTRKSLQYAVDFMQIEKTHPFHRAVDDTIYTASIMKKMNLELVKEYESVDYYRPPRVRKEEVNIVFRRYAKYVSHLFHSKEAAMADREVLSSRCYECGKVLRKHIHWFPVGQKQYLMLAVCPQHGFLKGKIRVKKTDGGKIFIVKTLKLIDQAQAKEVIDKKEQIKKHQNKRKKQNSNNSEEAVTKQ